MSESDDARSEAGSTAEPGHRPGVAFEAEAFLCESFAALRRTLERSGFHADRIGIEVGGEPLYLTLRENGALTSCGDSLTGKSTTKPIDRLLALVATTSFWIGCETGALLLPTGARAPAPSRPLPDRQTARSALALAASLADRGHVTAHDRGDRTLADVLATIGHRLERLTVLLERLPEARGTTVPLDLKSTLTTEDLAGENGAPARSMDDLVRDAQRPAREAGTRRTERATKTRTARTEAHTAGAAAPRSTIRATRQWKPLLLAVAAVAAIVLSAVNAYRQVAAERAPVAAESVEASDLADVFPSAILPAVAPGETEARVGVGPEWLGWSVAERRQRIGRACVVLGDKAWRSAVFLGPEGQPVATWQDGVVTLLDASAPRAR